MRRGEVVNQIAQKIKEIAPRVSTILFGSEARGDARQNSDIDLLILIPDEMANNYHQIKSEIAGELYMIELENEVLISPLILLQRMWDKRVTPFTCNVAREGILL